MKNKVTFKIFIISIFTLLLFCSCEPDAPKGHLLRVIVYYPCQNPSTSFIYPGAPFKENYDIYQVLVHIGDDTLTGDMLESMNERVKACGIQNFSKQWYTDSDFQTPLTPGKLTSKWDDNYYNYLVFTQVEEDLTSRFTEYIVRDSNNVYRLNTSHKDIFPVDTTSVNFSDELMNKSYSPYEVSKVYYVNKTSGLKQSEWQAGQPLQGKKLFVDLNSAWSNQKYIKFVNSVIRNSPDHESNYNCTSIQKPGKIRDFFPSTSNNSYEYLKIYKGSFLPDGDIEWNKDKLYAPDDTINPYELIRIDLCKTKLKIFMIDSSGKAENFTYLYDIAFESEEDTISEYDLGQIGNDVNEKQFIVHQENSSWLPKAYYKVKTSDTEDLPAEEVWTPDPDSGDSYIQIKDGCKIDKLKNKIYILVEGTL